jgi:hypothetical protein
LKLCDLAHPAGVAQIPQYRFTPRHRRRARQAGDVVAGIAQSRQPVPTGWQDRIIEGTSQGDGRL